MSLTPFKDAALSLPLLISLWNAGEDPEDATGLNDGAYKGAPTIGEPSLLPSGEGRSMRPSLGNHLEVPDHASLDLGDNWSVFGWARPDAIGVSDGDLNILSKGSGAYYLRIAKTARFQMLRSQVANLAESTIEAKADENYFVVATKAGSKRSLSINNVDVTSLLTNSTCVNTNTPLLIGGGDAGFPGLFDGWLQYIGLCSGELTPEEIAMLYAAALPQPGAAVRAQPQHKPHVVAIAEGGTGRGHDLTDDIEGLSWSSVNPGGDERCSFTLKRSWFSDNPEIARGNLLRVFCGIDVLWQGRIEETDRSAESSEAIAVTAYGLGARLKDGTFQEIFIDRDLGAWSEPSTQRRITALNAGARYEGSMSTGAQDTGEAGPAIVFSFSRFDGSVEIGEAFYYGNGIDLSEIRAEVKRLVGEADGNFTSHLRLSPDDVRSESDDSADYDYGNTTNGVVVASTNGRKYGIVFVSYGGGDVGDKRHEIAFVYPRVIGRHSIPTQGDWPNEGFTVDQMIEHIVGLVDGIAIRHIDPQSYTVQQAAFKDPTLHEDGITELNKLEGCDWGTWGPDSPLDNSIEGQFDFKNREPDVQHWFVRREDCEDIDLHSETSTLYGAVDVTYEDVSGARHTVRRTIDVPDLDGAEMTRVYPLDIGKSKLEVAEKMGDAFLAIWGQFAPARGSFTTKLPVRHHRRGKLPPIYLRADGSNTRVGDILSSSDAFALDTTPDRRTTFPIKRVDIDCSGEVLAARVDVDQANDTLSILQARQSLAAELIP